ncbi:MAG: epoxyqueuosine reductase QueH [Bacillota bacterium]|nr:epoxyqueuosine reductase QueH [Bacillota bacterium]
MRLLLHTCCGPCSIFPLDALREEGHAVTACYCNPNIHPYREWERRLLTLRDYLGRVGADLEVDDRYDLKAYLEAVLPCADDPARRCPVCYRIRLDEVARRAAAGGYDAFTTTLLVSPYQDHGAVARAGREAGEVRGVSFYYRDFRPGWKQAVRISRELGMYRQGYCGCLFSERERYYRAARRGG